MLEKPGKSNKSMGLDWIEPKGDCILYFTFQGVKVEWVKGCTDFGVFNFPPRAGGPRGKLYTFSTAFVVLFPVRLRFEQIRVLNDHYGVFTRRGVAEGLGFVPGGLRFVTAKLKHSDEV